MREWNLMVNVCVYLHVGYVCVPAGTPPASNERQLYELE